MNYAKIRKDLLTKKKQMESTRDAISKEEGKKEQALSELKKLSGCSTIEKAEVCLSEKRTKITKKERSLQKRLDKISAFLGE